MKYNSMIEHTASKRKEVKQMEKKKKDYNYRREFLLNFHDTYYINV